MNEAPKRQTETRLETERPAKRHRPYSLAQEEKMHSKTIDPLKCDDNLSSSLDTYYADENEENAADFDERDYGISVFLNPATPGISGDFKLRYTDFIVNEVDLNGNVVRLTDMETIPGQASIHPISYYLKEQMGEEVKAMRDKELWDILGGEDASRLLDFAQQTLQFLQTREQQLQSVGRQRHQSLDTTNSNDSLHVNQSNRNENGTKPKSSESENATEVGYKDNKIDLNSFKSLTNSQKELRLTLSPVTTKEERTRIHTLIKMYFPYLQSETKSQNIRDPIQGNVMTQQYISITPKSFSTPFSKRLPKYNSREWPPDRPNYLQFVLYKENKDTTECTALLSQFTGIKRSNWLFAGTKDKRAVTSQLCTVFKYPAENLRALNERLRGIKLGNYRYVEKPLELGDLLGNRFVVVLRNVEASDEEIAAACECVRTRGFVNYFGPQRFGRGAIPTFRIGQAALKGDFKTVVELILQPRFNEENAASEARRYWQQTHDVEGTIQRLPQKHFVIESTILEALRRYGTKQYRAAFQALPRNMRLLYVHSYQSWLWNLMATERIRRLGSERPVEGDLIQDPLTRRVFILTNALLASSGTKYTIEDVVLPLPGFAIEYPANDIGALYHVKMAEDGIDLTNKEKVANEFILPGSYRKLIERPKDMEWQILRYEHNTAQLTRTDLDILYNRPEPRSIPNGKLKALRLTFTLASASYATMCIRELMKQPTNATFKKMVVSN
jgi:tRNA pseudouridine13 synthase